ncbi:hypothetical protein [Enterococcus faecalis]|uniref:hypothetical protein n=1 Tax=Enterococcus faecalis TaxID=1351 RepID=UPI00331F1706
MSRSHLNYDLVDRTYNYKTDIERYINENKSSPRGHWNIHTENSGRKPNNYWAIKLVVRFFCLAFSILVD